MDRIIAEVECDPHYRRVIDAEHPAPEATIADAVCCALRRAAGILPLAATVTYTCSGFWSLRAARERPSVPILGLTPSTETARRLALVWGMHPVRTQQIDHVSDMVAYGCGAALRDGFARPGDISTIAAGMPFGSPGTNNLLRIARVEAAGGAPEPEVPAQAAEARPSAPPVPAETVRLRRRPHGSRGRKMCALQMTIGSVVICAEPLDTLTAAALDAAPCSAKVRPWGDEVHFSTPVVPLVRGRCPRPSEGGRGSPFGQTPSASNPTPISRDDEIRLASPCYI